MAEPPKMAMFSVKSLVETLKLVQMGAAMKPETRGKLLEAIETLEGVQQAAME